MIFKKYTVTRNHVSEFPEPISFSQGTCLTVGERYQGPEDWKDWVFCSAPTDGGILPEMKSACGAQVGS